jgi:hypothetical protein
VLTSILGQVIELRLDPLGPVGGGSAWWEPEAEGAVVPPRDGEVEVGEAAVDEDGVVGAQVEVDGDGVVGDVQGAGGVEEVSPELVGGGGFVAG